MHIFWQTESFNKKFLLMLYTTTIFTILLKFWTEKRAINKNFFGFHLILIKFGEVVVTHVYYNFTRLHHNRMKNKKSYINSPFFYSEFQGVSRIVIIVHSVMRRSWICHGRKTISNQGKIILKLFHYFMWNT